MSGTSPDDTIAALATPPGEGGIGIVRLSGDRAIGIVHSVFVSSRGRDIRTDKRQIFHGEIQDAGLAVDEVLVHVMRAPYTYTREDVVEVNCHGGAGPLNAVLGLVLKAGCRLAGPGEFTQRAFLNGRIDLVQAEAVIDRIRARTAAGLRAASAASCGLLSEEIYQIRDALLVAKSHIEAAIDFPDDDLPELIRPELRENVAAAHSRMDSLLETADAGRILREGATVAIAGRPNVGKSSLFNAMLRESRAIVTAQPGTTRDVLEEVVTIEGIPVRLTDMAGLRETVDEVERIGVELARRAITQSAMVLFMVDASEGAQNEDSALLEDLGELGVPVILIANKVDLGDELEQADLAYEFAATQKMSALTGQGLPELEATLSDLLRGGIQLAPDQALLTRVHQKDSLRRAAEAVGRIEANFGSSPEFLSIDIDEALRALGEITGETTPDMVLDQIFSSFCIGK